MLVEVCANSFESARIAEAAGADRIELCSELAVGGVTPSSGMLEVVRERIGIPIRVLVRPRSGDFCYSDAEFRAMVRDVRHCAELGFEGVVSGCLYPDGRIDTDRTEALMAAAGGARFTFHRAFDRCTDPHAALAQLDAMGVDTILSSGQATSAVLGLPLLESLQKRARRCRLMPGGGIHAGNIGQFRGKGFGAVHLSGIPGGSSTEHYNGPPMNTPALLREGQPLHTSSDRVRAVVQALKTRDSDS